MLREYYCHTGILCSDKLFKSCVREGEIKTSSVIQSLGVFTTHRFSNKRNNSLSKKKSLSQRENEDA